MSPKRRTYLPPEIVALRLDSNPPPTKRELIDLAAERVVDIFLNKDQQNYESLDAAFGFARRQPRACWDAWCGRGPWKKDRGKLMRRRQLGLTTIKE